MLKKLMEYDDCKEGILNKVKKELEKEDKEEEKPAVAAESPAAPPIKQEENADVSNNLVDLKPCKKESAFASLLEMPNLLPSGRNPIPSSLNNTPSADTMNFTSSFQSVPHNQPMHMMPHHNSQAMHHHHHPMHIYPPANHFQPGCFNAQPPMPVHQPPHHFNQLWRDQM